MRSTICLALIFACSVSIFSQEDKTFQEKVNECYDKPEFENIHHRILNEKICFIDLDFPEFEINTLDGELVNLETFEDKVVVLNFWFTACPPCINEIPDLNAIYDLFDPSEVLFFAPSTDDPETIKQFQKQYLKIKATILPEATNLLRTTLASKSGFPTTIIIDQKGKIRHYFSGAVEGLAQMEGMIASIIEENKSGQKK